MPKRREPEVVWTFAEAEAAFREEESIALDLETSGFSPWKDRPHVIALYGKRSHTVAILHYPTGVAIPGEVLDWLASFGEIVTHNGVQFDLLFLAVQGMEWDRPRIYDTMIGEQSVQIADRKDIKVNLADTAKRRLGRALDKTIAHGRWGNRELDREQVEYVLHDIQYLLELKEKQEVHGESIGVSAATAFEMELAVPVVRMELRGLPVDLGALDRYFASRKDRQQENLAYLLGVCGEINLNSNPQLQGALRAAFGPDMFPDTKAERLLGYKQAGGEVGEFADRLLQYRNYRQRQSMFGDEWKQSYVVDHGGQPRVHGKFWQIGTNTGRFSSTQPNLQQIPRDMRDVFGGAEDEVVGKSDYSAIEVRIAAALADDGEMVAAFNAGEDIHRLVGSAGFNKPAGEITKDERQLAKAMSFTLLFGGGPGTFKSYAGSRGSYISAEEAEEAVRRFFSRFQGLRRMRDVAEWQAAQGRPVTITYPTGLKRQIRGAELRATVLLNNSVQGLAAAGLKKALLEMEASGVSGNLAAVVHDEVVYTAAPGEIEEVRREVDRCMIAGMRWAMDDCTPVSVGVESTWGGTWKGDPANEVATESGA